MNIPLFHVRSISGNKMKNTLLISFTRWLSPIFLHHCRPLHFLLVRFGIRSSVDSLSLSRPGQARRLYITYATPSSGPTLKKRKKKIVYTPHRPETARAWPTQCVATTRILHLAPACIKFYNFHILDRTICENILLSFSRSSRG